MERAGFHRRCVAGRAADYGLAVVGDVGGEMPIKIFYLFYMNIFMCSYESVKFCTYTYTRWEGAGCCAWSQVVAVSGRDLAAAPYPAPEGSCRA